MRFFACLVAAGALSTVGGALFYLMHGGTTLTRAIAYGFWIAAAVTLVLMAAVGSNRIARRFHVPFVEGWLFVTGAITLTVAGVVVDVLGSR